jgi:hypothetical protein
MIWVATHAMLLAATLGCRDDTVQIAREGAERQAEQNRTMAALQERVTSGTRDLVAGEAAAREQGLSLQRDLQAQRARIADREDALDAERRAMAAIRRTESVWAAILPASGGVVMAIVALAFAWLVIHGLKTGDDALAPSCQVLVDFLIEDAQISREVAEQRVLPCPPAAGALPTIDPPGDCDAL